MKKFFYLIILFGWFNLYAYDDMVYVDTDFDSSEFLIGDFNGWRLPTAEESHDAIKMQLFVLPNDAIGGGVFQVSGIDFKELGKFVVYSPDSVYTGFNPSFATSLWYYEGEISCMCVFSTGHSLEEVIPFEIGEIYKDNVTFALLMDPMSIIIRNATLSPELLTMAEMDEVAVADNVRELGRYSISGVPVDDSYKGLVLIRYADGTTRKVVVR